MLASLGIHATRSAPWPEGSDRAALIVTRRRQMRGKLQEADISTAPAGMLKRRSVAPLWPAHRQYFSVRPAVLVLHAPERIRRPLRWEHYNG